VYSGTGWNEKAKRYKNLKKESKKMKGLVNPIKKKADAPASDPITQAVEAPVHGAVKDMEEPIVATAARPEEDRELSIKQETKPTPPPEPEVVKEEEPPVQAPVTQAEEPVAEEAPTQEQPKPERQPRQRKAPAPVAGQLPDLEKIKAQLTVEIGPVTGDRFDKTLTDIRALRDIQIQVARLMTNLASELAKTAKNAVDKYALIQNIMK
jgi:hypothetical protein